MAPTRYAVVGDPVAHSLSPRIHRLFAEQTGQRMDYAKIRVAAPEFAGFVADFFREGGGGLNVTAPHKTAAFELAGALSPRARRARAVNTLLPGGPDGPRGENTDGTGLLRDLKDNHGVAVAGRRVLVLGAGGAARGALAALADEGPALIAVANRGAARRDALLRDFGPPVTGRAAAEAGPFDLVVNAAAAGAPPPAGEARLAEGCRCYDMAYGRGETPFARWARERGAAPALDGLGMLVEQAAESFRLWRGARPRAAPVIAALRREAG